MEEQLSAGPETPEGRELSGNIAAIRSFFAMLAGEYAAALDLGQRAEVLLPERSIQARSLLPYTIGSAYRGQGEYEKASEAFALVTQMGEKNHNLIVWGTGKPGSGLWARPAYCSSISSLLLSRLYITA